MIGLASLWVRSVFLKDTMISSSGTALRVHSYAVVNLHSYPLSCITICWDGKIKCLYAKIKQSMQIKMKIMQSSTQILSYNAPFCWKMKSARFPSNKSSINQALPVCFKARTHFLMWCRTCSPKENVTHAPELHEDVQFPL